MQKKLRNHSISPLIRQNFLTVLQSQINKIFLHFETRMFLNFSNKTVCILLALQNTRDSQRNVKKSTDLLLLKNIISFLKFYSYMQTFRAVACLIGLNLGIEI